MRILEPLSGTVFVSVAGETPGVVCRAQSNAENMRINGVQARREGDVFTAIVPLQSDFLELEFRTESEWERAHVWRVNTDRRIYRLSVDDNVRFLQDICEKGYKSLFENPYLAMYRRLHEEYGVKVHMNIYWESPEYGDFTLADFPDRYRQEWLDNRDWLHLSFHARADQPGWPYLKAGYQQVYDDCSLVMDEIRRFAGEAGPVTTLHFAEANSEGIRALYDCGIRVLLGDYAEDKDGNPAICYSATKEQYNAVRQHCFWRDPETRMIFCPCDKVLNTGTLESVRASMDEFAARWPGRAFVDILIHEQYFYKDYAAHEPDYEQRIRAGIEWCMEQGYEPGFIDEIIRPEFLSAIEQHI